jgi:hypothetical protein
MKKVKKIISSVMFILAITNSFCQTLSLDVLTVNGQSVSNNIINLGPYDGSVSVTLSTQVTMPNIPSDSYPGTINIYYKKETNFPANIPTGGFGGNLFFLGSTTAYRNFSITLNPPAFNLTGGFVYCEYTSNSGLKYVSTNRSVIKSTITTNPITVTPCELCQYVPYGGYAILPRIQANHNWYIKESNNPIPTDPLFPLINKPIQSSYSIYQKENSSDINADCKTLIINSTPSTGCTITGYENNIAYNNLSNSFNNSTSSYLFLPLGYNTETIIGNQATYTCNATAQNPSSTIIPLTYYQWQKRHIDLEPECSDFANWYINHSWQNIPGATNANFNPGSVTEAFEYRRLAKISENDINSTYYTDAFSSNVISIVPTFGTNSSKNPHVICCNQTTANNVQTANMLTANVDSLNGIQTMYYIWQVSKNNLDWITVKSGFGTSSNTYTPIRPYFWGYGSTGSTPSAIASNTFYYRRIIVSYDNIYYPSNTVSIYFKRTTRDRYAANTNLDSSTNISIYPNPSENLINIESPKDLNNFEIKIIDITGRTVLSVTNIEGEKLFNKILDISILPKGIYSIIFESKIDDEKIIEKIIKN